MMRFLVACICLSAGWLSLHPRTASAQPSALGTSFPYQGTLKAGGVAYTGTAEFQFRLYDAALGGSQIGTQIALIGGNAPTVTNGLFTATLDFGASAFNGDARWLEMDVRTGVGRFTTLAPRQAISATPYALQTRGIFVDSANRVGIGTSLPQIPLHLVAPNLGPTPGEGIRIQGAQSTAANLAYLSFANGAGTAIGYVGDGGGGDNNIYLGAYGADIGLVNSTFGTALIAKASGRIGIGTSAPSNKLSVIGSADFSGNVGIGTTSPAYPLHIAGANDAIQVSCSGIGVSANSTGAWGVYGTSTSATGRGIYGWCASTTGTNYGVVGRSNSASGYDFYAEGSGVNYGAPSSVRWKRNIELIDSPLDKVEAMRGVFFDWDAKHGGQHDVGFIGEEVGRVLPEVAAWEPDGKFVTGMDYSKLTPLLVEAVKALRAEKDLQMAQMREQHALALERLQIENDRLQQRLATVEAAIARLDDRKNSDQ